MNADPRLLAGRYRLDRPLGHGGMGTVWLGHDERLTRDVAIKVLAPQAAADPTATQRFEREARTLATVGHPGVVRVHDFGIDQATGSPFLVMELLPGPSLDQIIAERAPLPIAEATRYAAETAEALSAAHAAGIIHRDIKPANLVLDAIGSVRLVDFGIARTESAGNVTLTMTGTVMGSAAYLAPELATGAAASPQADLYALGCVLFALLTGRPPFSGDSPVAIVSQHISAPPPDITSLRPDTPYELSALVSELLTKDPNDRPADALDVARRLRGVSPTATGDQTIALPAAAVPVGAPAGGRRARRRRDEPSRPPWLLPAAAGAGVLLLVAAFSLANGNDEPTGGTQARTLSPPTATATPTPTPTRSQTPTPTPTPTAAEVTVELALADLEARIAALSDTRSARQLARELNKRFREITNKINEGDYETAAKKLKEFRNKVEDAEEDDRISERQADQLGAAATAVLRALPEEDD